MNLLWLMAVACAQAITEPARGAENFRWRAAAHYSGRFYGLVDLPRAAAPADLSRLLDWAAARAGVTA